jgi:hypothetical protein
MCARLAVLALLLALAAGTAASRPCSGCAALNATAVVDARVDSPPKWRVRAPPPPPPPPPEAAPRRWIPHATPLTHAHPSPRSFAEYGAELTGDAAAAGCVLLPAAAAAPGDGGAATAASPTCGRSTAVPAEKLGSCAAGAQAALDAHNAARARYGAAPLLWSRTLSEYAQGVSDTCVFQHSNGPYGENLAIGTALSCRAAVDLWVAEESSWRAGGDFSAATGHFTQVVWRGSVQVGCAARACARGNFVTCSYYTPGNVVGQFGANVGARGAAPECVAPAPGAPPPAPSPSPSPSPAASPPASPASPPPAAASPAPSPRPPSPAPAPPAPTPAFCFAFGGRQYCFAHGRR